VAIGLIGCALALLVAAGPAAAKDEFEDGFKDELGRIAAHEAVGAGRAALGYILLGHPGYGDHRHDPYPYGYGYNERVVYYPSEVHHHHYYYGKKHHRGHHHRHHGHHGHHGYRGHDCDDDDDDHHHHGRHHHHDD
jgi:hypothetical protein